MEKTRQPDIQARKEYYDLIENKPTEVTIPGTRRKVRLTGIKPGTMRWLTGLWIERDLASARVSSGGEVLKDLCIEPLFAIKEACILSLNSYWKLKLLYPLVWRWWAYVWQYTESQMTPIIAEGKKKLQHKAHYENMIFSLDMRTDQMTMTKRQAEQYQAELLSAGKQLSSRTSQSTEGQGRSFSDLFQSLAGAMSGNSPSPR